MNLKLQVKNLKKGKYLQGHSEGSKRGKFFGINRQNSKKKIPFNLLPSPTGSIKSL